MMQNLALEEPSNRFKETYLQGISQLIDNGYLAGKLDPDYITKKFDQYLIDIHNFEIGVNIPDGFSRQSEFWAIRENKDFVGTLKIRHSLCNEYLRTVGGHIGIAVIPTEWRKGYGTHILELALHKAKLIGLKKVLCTCSETKTASIRLIVKNGGQFDGKVFYPKCGMKNRYWIEL